MSKWIGVSNAIPSEDKLSLGESEIVLLYTVDGYIGTGFLERYNDSKSWVSNQGMPIEFVTHWMELPSSPEY